MRRFVKECHPSSLRASVADEPIGASRITLAALFCKNLGLVHKTRVVLVSPDKVRTFGFGSSLIDWVKVLYNKTESCILNNGWSSNFFSLKEVSGKAARYHHIFSSLQQKF